MRRLHVKIFLWFWVGVVVVSATLITSTELTHSRTEDDRRWREKYSARVDLWARQEADILSTEGVPALTKYVGSFQSDPGVLNYIFDAAGSDVLERDAPPQVRQMVSSMAGAPGGTQRIDTAQRIIAERILDADGRPYVVVVDFPAPSFLNRSLIEFLFADLNTGGLDNTSLLRLGAVVLVAGLVCFVLARHIASPIDRLRAATRRIADEQLHTRVDKRVLNRSDELADLGRDFDRMAERIEHLVVAQRQLLADVSHALRSPLARLNVALGLARRDAAPDSREHLDRIERETDRLNALIGQLLTMARVDSNVDLDRQTVFDLGGVVDEVASDADYEARHRHCTVQFEPHQECLVNGAREVLRGAIENVVRNAVRHTADATSVEVSMESGSDAEGPRAIIRVRDHGPGVPREAVGRLFTPFHRIDGGGRETGAGTGLGLAIARRAFEVHGGTATASNAPDGGLEVVLEMPLFAANQRAAVANPGVAAPVARGVGAGA